MPIYSVNNIIQIFLLNIAIFNSNAQRKLLIFIKRKLQVRMLTPMHDFNVKTTFSKYLAKL